MINVLTGEFTVLYYRSRLRVIKEGGKMEFDGTDRYYYYFLF